MLLSALALCRPFANLFFVLRIFLLFVSWFLRSQHRISPALAIHFSPQYSSPPFCFAISNSFSPSGSFLFLSYLQSISSCPHSFFLVCVGHQILIIIHLPCLFECLVYPITCLVGKSLSLERSWILMRIARVRLLFVFADVSCVAGFERSRGQEAERIPVQGAFIPSNFVFQILQLSRSV